MISESPTTFSFSWYIKKGSRPGSAIRSRARQENKSGTYYHTHWQPMDKLSLKLEGLNMDAVYEGFIRQIAGERLQDQPGDLKEAVVRDEQRQKLKREIADLENKVRREKQLNIQVTLNSGLKRLRKELEGL